MNEYNNTPPQNEFWSDSPESVRCMMDRYHGSRQVVGCWEWRELADIAAEMAEWAAVKALDIAMRRRIAGYEDMPLYSRIQLGRA